MSKLKIVFCVSAVALIWISYRAIQFSYYTPRWNAVFYTYANKGLSPHFEGPYMNEEECTRVGNELMAQKKIRVTGDLEPATFFCGKDCDSDPFDRDGAVFDMTCSEGKPPEWPDQ